MDRMLYNWSEFHAPVKFKLDYVYDLQGEKQKAYELFKYFVANYGDCDEFHPHNVQYAKDKIAEYEREFPEVLIPEIACEA